MSSGPAAPGQFGRKRRARRIERVDGFVLRTLAQDAGFFAGENHAVLENGKIGFPNARHEIRYVAVNLSGFFHFLGRCARNACGGRWPPHAPSGQIHAGMSVAGQQTSRHSGLLIGCWRTVRRTISRNHPGQDFTGLSDPPDRSGNIDLGPELAGD